MTTSPDTDHATHAVIDATIKYLSVPCVVGHEDSFLQYLKEDFETMGLVAVRHEGLLEVHGKKPRSAILCAHIDRHGLISIGHGEYVYAAQYIKEIKYGQNNRASQKEIANITKRFEGERVYAYDPQNGKKLGAGIIKACDPFRLKGDALFEVEGLGDIPLGIPLAYARTARTENGSFKGQLDNALSLGVIRTLFEDGFQGTALLTCEEEIGKSWTHLAAWLVENNIETKKLIVIDTSPFMENDPIDKGMVIFRNRDMSENFNPEVVTALRKRAETLGLPYLVKDEILLAKGKSIEQLGSTELGRLVQGAKGLWSGATIQVPTIMYHTSNETTSVLAIRNYYALLHNVLMEQPLDLSIGIKTVRA